MKFPYRFSSALFALVLSACAQDMGLQTDEAELAKQIMADNCVVGRYGLTLSSQPLYMRQGVINKNPHGHRMSYRKPMSTAPIAVYSIKELGDGWVEVDASGSGSRENFYFNRETAEFACTIEEWRAVQADPAKRYLERTPLIMNRMQRIN